MSLYTQEVIGRCKNCSVKVSHNTITSHLCVPNIAAKDDFIKELQDEVFRLKDVLTEKDISIRVFEEVSHVEYKKLKEENRILAINGLNDEARCTEIHALQGEIKNIHEAFSLIYTASADGERAMSCCHGTHFKTTLMAGDRVYVVSYANGDPFKKAHICSANNDFSPVSQTETKNQ